MAGGGNSGSRVPGGAHCGAVAVWELHDLAAGPQLVFRHELFWLLHAAAGLPLRLAIRPWSSNARVVLAGLVDRAYHRVHLYANRSRSGRHASPLTALGKGR